MNEGAEPRGLHRRIAARERRLAGLEAAMLSLQGEFTSAAGSDGDAASGLARAQEAYDATLLELRELQASARRLRDWGISAGDTASWAGVCRALGMAAGGGAHRSVRSAEPVLHMLLHRFAFDAFCALDGATYQE